MSTNDAPKASRAFGPYELLEKVGTGGMGSVYKARLKGQKELVAVKIAKRVVAGDPVLVQRFQNEFKLASQLQHPNLVQFLACALENNVPYLVMEFVSESLDARLKNKGPMSLPMALATFSQVGAALEFIHQRNLVHRDIKPGNILIDAGGQAKLADLGLVKNLDSHSWLTPSGAGLGTLEYAAPEQFDNAKNVDLRADIYALAVTLYVALSGKFPFERGSQMRILMQKLEHRFTPLSQLLDGISPALDQVIIRSLHPDPALRPNSIPEFLRGMRGEELSKTVLMPKPAFNEPSSTALKKQWKKPLPHAADVKAPKGAASNEERRRGKRHSWQLATALSFSNISGQDAWPAQVMDISSEGLRLQVQKSFEPNTLLTIFLPGKKTGQHTPHQIRICWIKSLPGKTWLVGCKFVSPLNDHDMDRFLTGDLCMTRVLRKPKAASSGEPQ